MKKHIPNLLTCGNVACGALGIRMAYQGNLYAAAYYIILAAMFDFLDGFAARKLGVHSPIGKELDSLADVISFGLLPGVILQQLILQQSPQPWQWLQYVALAVPIFSALRLAKFNIDERQTDSFIGVPTPANALLLGSLPFALRAYPALASSIGHPFFLCALALAMSLLLVAELPLFALKFKDFSLQNNKLRFGFLALSALIVAFFQFAGIGLCIVLYIGLSVLTSASEKPASPQ